MNTMKTSLLIAIAIYLLLPFLSPTFSILAQPEMLIATYVLAGLLFIWIDDYARTARSDKFRRFL